MFKVFFLGRCCFCISVLQVWLLMLRLRSFLVAVLLFSFGVVRGCWIPSVSDALLRMCFFIHLCCTCKFSFGCCGGDVSQLLIWVLCCGIFVFVYCCCTCKCCSVFSDSLCLLFFMCLMTVTALLPFVSMVGLFGVVAGWQDADLFSLHRFFCGCLKSGGSDDICWKLWWRWWKPR